VAACLRAWAAEWVAAWAAWTIEAVSAETPNPFGAKPNSYSLTKQSTAAGLARVRLFCFLVNEHRHWAQETR